MTDVLQIEVDYYPLIHVTLPPLVNDGRAADNVAEGARPGPREARTAE